MGVARFDPMRNAEKECGMLGGAGSGAQRRDIKKGVPSRGRAPSAFNSRLTPAPISSLDPEFEFLFRIRHWV
jgi:hypothetical protein